MGLRLGLRSNRTGNFFGYGSGDLRDQDDRGIEGVIILPDKKRRKVRKGVQLSSSSVKQSEHEDGKSREEAQAKQAATLEIKSNTKAGQSIVYMVSLVSLLEGR